MITGIYLLYYKNTDMLYVGQSIDIHRRYAEHLSQLRSGTHSRKLQNAFEIYGIPSLEIECICSKEDLDNFEDYYIQLWDSKNNGFNTNPKSSGGYTTFGEDRVNAMYTNAQLIELVTFIVENSNLSLKDISNKFNISYSVISNICNGTGHTWLSSAIPETYKKLLHLKGTRNRGEHHSLAKYSNDTIRKVFKLILNNTKPKDISEICGVNVNTVYNIRGGTHHLWLKDEYPEEYKAMLNKLKDYPPIIAPDGTIHKVQNISKFAREHNLIQSALSRVLNGKANSTKGWKLFST